MGDPLCPQSVFSKVFWEVSTGKKHTTFLDTKQRSHVKGHMHVSVHHAPLRGAREPDRRII